MKKIIKYSESIKGISLNIFKYFIFKRSERNNCPYSVIEIVIIVTEKVLSRLCNPECVGKG